MLDHGIPASIHCARHFTSLMPSSSSVTPNWNPHDGQISYDAPPLAERGGSARLGQPQTGQRFFLRVLMGEGGRGASLGVRVGG